MPSWKVHLIFSLFLVITWISIIYYANFLISFESLIALVIITIFASLFPDIDTRSSKMRDLFSFIIAAVAVGTYMFFYRKTWYYAPAYFVLLYFILKYLPTKHRGLTHTFKFSILFSVALALVCFSFVVQFVQFPLETFLFWFLIVFSSYNLHLILDKK